MARRPPPLPILLCIICAVLNIVYWLALSCYFGPSASPDAFVHNLHIRVVSFDNGIVGTAFTTFFSTVNTNSSVPLPTYYVDSASGLTAADVDGAINHGDDWGAVYVNANATAKLMQALLLGDTTYDPTSALTFVYDEGRSSITVNTRVVGPTTKLLGAFTARFASQLVSTIATNYSAAQLSTVATKAPALLTRPVAYATVNLHPFTAPVTNAGLLVGMILVMVFAMILTTALFKASEPACAHMPPTQKYTIRTLALLGFTGTLCLSFTLILTALHTTFSSAGVWVSFWLLQWLQMLVFAFLFAAVATFISPEVIPPIFFLTLILNATAGLSTLELASPFYLWGVALPLYHSSMASKTLLYGSYDRLSMNIPVLFAWLALTFGLFTFASLKKRAAPVADGAQGGPSTPKAVDEKGYQVDPGMIAVPVDGHSSPTL